MSYLLRENQVTNMISEFSSAFRAVKATLVTDNHGFPIATKLNHDSVQNMNWDENMLALTAITDRKLQNFENHIQIKRKINKDMNLLLVLKNTGGQHLHKFKSFNKILSNIKRDL